MCYHSQRRAALAEQEHDAEVVADRDRTASRTGDDRDAPADPDNFVEIDEVAERVDDAADDPGSVETEPKPVGFA
ncbi:hypothetical protein [Halobellus sp. EA9]|uniref:hypothetical protein n=1 Tax=Halobellus sp. EA9 TaxID=3421647 RepID=UPI003EB7A9CC